LLILPIKSTAGYSPLAFYTSDNERLRITTGGLVGIGTTSPSANLEVVGASNTATSFGSFIVRNSSNAGMSFGASSTSYAWIQGNVYGTGIAPIVLQSNGGNVGIGTTSPTDSQGFGSAVDIQNSSYGGVIYLRKSGATSTYGYFGYDQTALSASIAAYGANTKLLFNAGTGAIKMTLDSSGNLGLGVTPSAWSSSYNAFQIGSNGAIWADATTPSGLVSLTNNVYYNAGYKYLGTGRATEYYQYNGQHIWETAASGTAGNAIYFTQAMTLNASGNLSIGNTNNTYKLDVSGTGRFTSEVTVGYGLIMSAAVSSLFSQDGTLSYYSTTNGVYLNGAGAGGWLRLQASGVENNRTAINLFGSTAATGDQIRFRTNTTDQLIIASTGAATFSSSVQATSIIRTISSGGVIWTELQSDGVYSTNTDLYLYAPSSKFVSLWAGAAERLRITSGGNVGIGTSSPGQLLTVNGGDTVTIVSRFIITKTIF